MVNAHDLKKLYLQLTGEDKIRMAIRNYVEARSMGKGFLDCKDIDALRPRNDMEREAGLRLFEVFRNTRNLWLVADAELNEFQHAISRIKSSVSVLISQQLIFECVKESQDKEAVDRILKQVSFKIEGDKVKVDEDLISDLSAKVTRANASIARMRAIEAVIREVESEIGVDPLYLTGMRTLYQFGRENMESAISIYNGILDSLTDILINDSLRLDGQGMDQLVYEKLQHEFLVQPSDSHSQEKASHAR